MTPENMAHDDNFKIFLHFRDNLLELRVYYESLTFSDVKQVPSYDLYSLLGEQHTVSKPLENLKTCLFVNPLLHLRLL